MGLMKKDMGGAASVLGPPFFGARMIMTEGLDMLAAGADPGGGERRVRRLLPARRHLHGRGNGKTVEINNTDAEGRLVLADALAYAAEGALRPHRVHGDADPGPRALAVGPPISAPFFTDDDRLAEALSVATGRCRRPRSGGFPFHTPYEANDRAGDRRSGQRALRAGSRGAITAALFPAPFRWARRRPMRIFDIYGWCPSAAPAGPKAVSDRAHRALFPCADVGGGFMTSDPRLTPSNGRVRPCLARRAGPRPSASSRGAG